MKTGVRETVLSVLKGQSAQIGEIHHWASGDHQKTASGWKEIKKQVRAKLQELSKREAIGNEALKNRKKTAEALRRRIESINTLLARPDVSEEDKKKFSVEKEKAEEWIKKIIGNRDLESRRPYKKKEQFVADLKESVGPGVEVHIRSKFEPRLSKLRSERAALDKGKEGYNRILEEVMSTEDVARRAKLLEKGRKNEAALPENTPGEFWSDDPDNSPDYSLSFESKEEMEEFDRLQESYSTRDEEAENLAVDRQDEIDAKILSLEDKINNTIDAKRDELDSKIDDFVEEIQEEAEEKQNFDPDDFYSDSDAIITRLVEKYPRLSGLLSFSNSLDFSTDDLKKWKKQGAISRQKLARRLHVQRSDFAMVGDQVRIVLKGLRAQVGEVRRWADGDHIKTPTDWKAVKTAVKRDLDKHNRREALQERRKRRDEENASRLEKRVRSLEELRDDPGQIEKLWAKYPEVSRFGAKGAIESELRLSKKLLSYYRQDRSQKNSGKEAYLADLKDVLRSAAEDRVRGKFAPFIDRLQEKLDGLEEGGDRHAEITSGKSRSDAAAALRTERDSLTDRMNQAEERMESAVEKAIKKVDAEIEGLDAQSMEEQIDSVFEKEHSGPLAKILSRYGNETEYDRLDDRLKTIESERKDKNKRRHRVGDRLHIQRSTIAAGVRAVFKSILVMKGKRANVGEIREWKNGKVQKQADGTWKSVKTGSTHSEKSPEKAGEQSEKIGDLLVAPVGEKSIAVRGETMKHVDLLRAIKEKFGGGWNSTLKAWIFPARHREGIVAKLKEALHPAAPSEADVADFISSSVGENAGNEQKKLALWEVGTDEGERLRQATGLDLAGYKHVLENYGLKHIIKEHGDESAEAKRGQPAISEEDLALIPEILRSPDEVSLSEKKSATGMPVIIYKKNIGESVAYLEEVRTGRKELTPLTMYKRRSRGVLIDRVPEHLTPEATPLTPESRVAQEGGAGQAQKLTHEQEIWQTVRDIVKNAKPEIDQVVLNMVAPGSPEEERNKQEIQDAVQAAKQDAIRLNSAVSSGTKIEVDGQPGTVESVKLWDGELFYMVSVNGEKRMVSEKDLRILPEKDDTKIAEKIQKATPATRNRVQKELYGADPTGDSAFEEAWKTSFTPEIKRMVIDGQTVDVPDYTSFPPRNIVMPREKDILASPRPSWIPELPDEAMKSYAFLPPVYEDGGAYVIKGYRRPAYDYGTMSGRQDLNHGPVRVSLDILAATVRYYHSRAKALRAEAVQKKLEEMKARPGYADYTPEKLKKWAEKTQKRPTMLSSTKMLYDQSNIYKSIGLASNKERWDHYKKFRDALSLKSSDLDFQTNDVIDSSFGKGRETSYGDSGTRPDLLKSYGVLVKRQNGAKVTPEEVGQVREALDGVFSAFGNRSEMARKWGLKISHSGEVRMHARKALGIFFPHYRAIGVTREGGQKDMNLTLSHEFGHFMDYYLGEKTPYRYASEDSTSPAGDVASTFRRNMIHGKLSDYWTRTCECFARAMEQYSEHKQGMVGTEGSRGGKTWYMEPEDFEKIMVPKIENFLQIHDQHLKSLISKMVA